MEDKNRIRFMILKIQYLWETNPKLNFGQLLSKINQELDQTRIYEVTDEVLGRHLDNLIGLTSND